MHPLAVLEASVRNPGAAGHAGRGSVALSGSRGHRGVLAVAASVHLWMPPAPSSRGLLLPHGLLRHTGPTCIFRWQQRLAV